LFCIKNETLIRKLSSDKLSCRISDLRDLLDKKERILEEILREAEEVAKEHGTPRRTALVPESSGTASTRLVLVKRVLEMCDSLQPFLTFQLVCS